MEILKRIVTIVVALWFIVVKTVTKTMAKVETLMNQRMPRAEFWPRWILSAVAFAIATQLNLPIISAVLCYGVITPLQLLWGVRRLHDAGTSGWWILTTAIPVWFWILAARPSQQGPNQWGEEPGA